MNDSTKLRTGGQILIDQLKIHGVSAAFCVPGESYLAALDALYDARDTIRLIVARQDGNAAFMAEAYGKATGTPGICFVTRGPGATNASIGVHTAFQDSTPMILFVGQVGRDMADREAFQEIDFRRMFGQMTKWVAQIESAERIPEYVSHAFHTATSGRPGPVVLALPEDMLTDVVHATDARRYQSVQASASSEDMARLEVILKSAERPLAILGGTVWGEAACADFRAFAEANGLPVATSFRFQDLYDNFAENYVGDVGIGLNPKLAQRIAEADVLFVVGARLGEMTTSGYTLLQVPVPKQRLVHVHAGAEELGSVYQGELLINAGMQAFTRAIRPMRIGNGDRWKSWREGARADYVAWQAPRPSPGKVQLGEIVKWLRENMPADAMVTTGAGNFTGWFQRWLQFRRWRTQVSPTNGAMGYGVPAGVATKVAYPDRLVIAVSGDGDFMMSGQELATAVHHKLNVIFIVVNNGMYGTIRMHQEREYPGRVYATALTNPDFGALATAYGAHGEVVEETAQFAPAFARARASGKPALIELRVDPQAITTQTTLDAIRAQALAKAASK